MARKQKFEGGTKNRIIEVGGKMFFERGYDGTGIRAVMERVGADVGVFYYYFNTKEELFGEVLDRVMTPYQNEFEQMVEEAKEDPVQGLYHFFDRLQQIAVDFRAEYASNMHRSVVWAVRELALTTIEPYVEEILGMIVEKGANPVMDVHTSAIYLSHAVGSCLLKEDSEWVESVKPALTRSVDVLLGMKQD